MDGVDGQRSDGPQTGDRPLVTREHVSDLAVSHVAARKARETWEPM